MASPLKPSSRPPPEAPKCRHPSLRIVSVIRDPLIPSRYQVFATCDLCNKLGVKTMDAADMAWGSFQA